MTAAPSRVRSRIHTQWMALAAAFVVLAGALVAWALTNAADRTSVVRAARPVNAGVVIERAHLSITSVGFDAEVSGLVPAVSIDALVGRVASVDISEGSLIVAGMWRDEAPLPPGSNIVGAVLQPGTFPDGISRGDSAWAASTDSVLVEPAVGVHIVDVGLRSDGSLTVNLAVPAAQSEAVARLAATNRLLLIGRIAEDGR